MAIFVLALILFTPLFIMIADLYLPNVPPGWVILGFIPIMVSVAVSVFWAVRSVSNSLNRNRREAVSRKAAELGFSFDPIGDTLIESDFPQLPLFRSHPGGYLENVMRKNVKGTEIVLVDHFLLVGGGRYRRWCNHTLVAFHVPLESAFPDFEMRPKDWLDRVLGRKYEDVDFDSHRKFSREYLLSGPNKHKPAIRKLFQPEVLAFFETETNWCVESHDHWLLVYRPRIGNGRLLEPKQFAPFLVETMQILSILIPPGMRYGMMQ